ncbi:MAG: hypothetical protein RSA22_07345 [Acinetobacter sp.]
MAARQTKTPGAPEAAKPTETPTDNQQVPDAADQSVSTAADTTQTATLETPSDADAQKEYAEFLEWRKNKGQLANPEPVMKDADQAVATKRTRQVCGEHGWTSEEY